MPQFTPLVSSLEFKPTTFEEYMQPYAMQEALYQSRRQVLDEKDDILAKYLPYINDSTPEAKQLYDAAQAQLKRNLEQLGKAGWNLNPEPLIDFKAQYRKTNSILDKASTELEQNIKNDREQQARDGSLMISYKNKAGRLITPNIDNMISGDYERHAVSGGEMQNNAMLAAKALSARTKAAFSNLKRHGSLLGYYETTTGDFAGVQSGVMMDWLMDPEKYQKEIGEYLSEVKRIGGEHAYKNMSGIFNGDFRNAMNSVIDRTDYENMSDNDKVRLNNYLWTGAYQGLFYDEHINTGMSQFDNRERDGGGRSGGRGGGGDGTIPLKAAVPKSYQQIFVPEEKGEGYENYVKLKNFFGVDDSEFGSTGALSFLANNMYALVNAHRNFDGTDYSKADKFIADQNVRDAGIKDYFSIFDENGNLLGEDEFVNRFAPSYKEIYSGDYYKKHKGSQDYGNLYLDLISTDPFIKRFDGITQATSGSGYDWEREWAEASQRAVKSQYGSIQEAILAAFEPNKENRDKILKAKNSDELFAKFVKDNNVNEATLQNKMIEMADTYANIDATMRYANFSSSNREIATDVLKLCKAPGSSDDGAIYRLNMVRENDPYTFRNTTKEDVIESMEEDSDGNQIPARHTVKYKDKEMKVNTEYKDEVSEAELFPKGNYDCIYIVPPDPTQGLIVQFPGGQKALLSPKELGSLYDKDKLSELSEQGKRARRQKSIVMAEIQQLNTDLYNYKQEGHDEEELQERIAEVMEKQAQYVEAYKAYSQVELRCISDITDLFKNNISTIYNVNRQD